MEVPPEPPKKRSWPRLIGTSDIDSAASTVVRSVEDAIDSAKLEDISRQIHQTIVSLLAMQSPSNGKVVWHPRTPLLLWGLDDAGLHLHVRDTRGDIWAATVDLTGKNPPSIPCHIEEKNKEE